MPTARWWGVEPGGQLPRQVLLGAEDPAAGGVRPGGYDGRFRTDEVGRDRRATGCHDDVHGQVVAVDPPAPRQFAARVAKHSHPVPVAIRR
jgi:hypothetical protein